MERKQAILLDLSEQMKLDLISKEEFDMASRELDLNFQDYDENTGLSIEEAADLALSVARDCEWFP